MIRAIIFDLDGVLIDSTKRLHFTALNLALSEISKKYVITKEEQHATFEALSTRQKLSILSNLKGLPVHLHKSIESRKQDITKKLLLKNIPYSSYATRSWLERLKKTNNIKLALCTNTIPESTLIILKKLRIDDGVFDVILTNADVQHPKPNPEIYIKAQNLLGVDPIETLIVEDSDNGVKSAVDSGAIVFHVDGPESATYVSRTLKYVDFIQNNLEKFPRKVICRGVRKRPVSGYIQTFYRFERQCVVCSKISQVSFLTMKKYYTRGFTGKCNLCFSKSDRPYMRGHRNPRWIGWKIRKNRQGYILLNTHFLSKEDKSLCDDMTKNNTKFRRNQIFEHKFILAKHLNRPLLKHETVHHKNGIRDDNSIENLELWSTSQPSGQRVSDKIDWCKQFLKDYGELCK